MKPMTSDQIENKLEHFRNEAILPRQKKWSKKNESEQNCMEQDEIKMAKLCLYSTYTD